MSLSEWWKELLRLIRTSCGQVIVSYWTAQAAQGRGVHDFLSYLGVELLSHIRHVFMFMFGCKIDLLSLIRSMHPFISGFEIEVIRLIRTFAWFHARLWNFADQIDQNTENILNFVWNYILWSSRQVRLIRDVSYKVRLWIVTAQTHQTCARFLAWLWNWADQTNQWAEFLNFIY